MKRLWSIMLLLCLIMQPFNYANAIPPGTANVTGFWLDAGVVNQIAASGATTLKVYAGIDATGNVCYIMVGGDDSYNTIGDQMFTQNYKGVCPPQCEFSSANLSGGNSYISEAQADMYVKAYKEQHAGAKNCAMFSVSALGTVLRNAYIKVSMSTDATATGIKADGTTNTKATASGSAATAELEGFSYRISIEPGVSRAFILYDFVVYLV